MLTVRDVLIVAAVVAVILWWSKKKCGCAGQNARGPSLADKAGRPSLCGTRR